MIRQDRTVLLEKLSEIADVYFGPETAWGKPAGGAFCGAYAAYYHLKMPDKESDGMSIGFANDIAEKYWESIGATGLYADFDFNGGFEIDPSGDWPSRSSADFYLKAAQHIHENGLATYRSRYVEDLVVPYRGVEFTDIRTGSSFTFREDKDRCMFESALKAHNQMNAKANHESMKESLDKFLDPAPEGLKTN